MSHGDGQYTYIFMQEWHSHRCEFITLYFDCITTLQTHESLREMTAPSRRIVRIQRINSAVVCMYIQEVKNVPR